MSGNDKRPGSPTGSDRSASPTWKDLNTLKRLVKHDSGLSISTEDSTSLSSESDEDDVSAKLEKNLQGYFGAHPLFESIGAKIAAGQLSVDRSRLGNTVARLALVKQVQVGFDEDGELNTIQTKHGVIQIIKKGQSGNNGTVFFGTDEHGQQIVIKALCRTTGGVRDVNGTLVERALRESENMHKNSVESSVLFDAKTNQLFVTMPRYYGKSAKREIVELSSRILSAENENPRLALGAMRKMFELQNELLNALDEFHKNTGMVHGDAWLDNFMVVENEAGKYVVKVIDYGACCPSGITATEYYAMHMQIGTGDYHVAPEIPNLANKPESIEYISFLKTMIRRNQAKLKVISSEQPEMINKIQAEIKSLKEEMELAASKQEEIDRITPKESRPRIVINPVKSLREYGGVISSKSDLHAAMASFVFESSELMGDDIWPVKSNTAQADSVKSIFLDFVRWSLINSCNSDWFYSKFEKFENRDFVASVRAERDLYMEKHGFTSSVQARVSVEEAQAKLQDFIARILVAEERAPGTSVAARVRAFEKSHKPGDQHST